MTNGPPDPGSKSSTPKSATSARPRLVARRDDVQAGRGEREQARKRPEGEGRQGEDASLNPRALVLGLVVLLALIFGTLFIINQMRCDPLYSDTGLLQPNKCR